MGAFLRGWRRKAGCVTLVMACALTGMWVRTVTLVDGVFYCPAGDFEVEVISARSRINISTGYGGMGQKWYMLRRNLNPMLPAEPFDDEGFTYNLSFWEIKYGSTERPAGLNRRWIVPYCWVVLPLTLLSTWLLLVNPRVAKAIKASEPAPTHGESHA